MEDPGPADERRQASGPPAESPQVGRLIVFAQGASSP
jgi:hypothetical protein